MRKARDKVQQEKFEKQKHLVEYANARTMRHQENLENVLARSHAENLILKEKVAEKTDRSNMFKAYKEALAEDSKNYAAKSRAEREVIRLEGRTFDQIGVGYGCCVVFENWISKAHKILKKPDKCSQNPKTTPFHERISQKSQLDWPWLWHRSCQFWRNSFALIFLRKSCIFSVFICRKNIAYLEIF